jgi:hypothetical protein
VAKKSRMGRPPNAQETVELTVTLPATAVGYLRFLAKNTLLGATHNDVATLILTNELVRMSKDEGSRPAIPQA